MSTDDKPSVYIETTIPSYLTAWPSRDLRRRHTLVYKNVTGLHNLTFA